jgi:hypothetical protein
VPASHSPNDPGHKEEREAPNQTLHQCPSKGLLKHQNEESTGAVEQKSHWQLSYKPLSTLHEKHFLPLIREQMCESILIKPGQCKSDI